MNNMSGFWSYTTDSKVRQPLIFVALFLIIFLMERVGWAEFFKRSTITALQPFQFFSMQLVKGAELPFQLVELQKTKAEDLVALRRSHAETLAKLSELEALQKENATLRGLIDTQGPVVKKKVLAVPITSYSLTAIARGSSSGIQPGALVLVADTLLGRVTEVEENQSFVTLFSDPASQPVLVQTEAGIQGVLIGTGKHSKLTQLPTQTEIKKGDRVVSVGQPGIPQGLFIGIVSSVEQSATAPMQTASIDQLNSFYTSSLVEVR